MKIENKDTREPFQKQVSRLASLQECRGAVLIYFVLVAALLIAVTGAVVDFGFREIVRSKLHKATDASALAARIANEPNDGERNAIAQRYFRVNYPENFLGTHITGEDIIVSDSGESPPERVTVQYEGNLDTRLIKILGQESLPYQVVSEVNAAGNNAVVEVFVSLDVSYSMKDNYIHLSNAFREFYDQLFGDFVGGVHPNLRIGALAFSGKIHPDAILEPTNDYTVLDNFRRQYIEQAEPFISIGCPNVNNLSWRARNPKSFDLCCLSMVAGICTPNPAPNAGDTIAEKAIPQLATYGTIGGTAVSKGSEKLKPYDEEIDGRSVQKFYIHMTDGVNGYGNDPFSAMRSLANQGMHPHVWNPMWSQEDGTPVVISCPPESPDTCRKVNTSQGEDALMLDSCQAMKDGEVRVFSLLYITRAYSSKPFLQNHAKFINKSCASPGSYFYTDDSAPDASELKAAFRDIAANIRREIRLVR